MQNKSDLSISGALCEITQPFFFHPSSIPRKPVKAELSQPLLYRLPKDVNLGLGTLGAAQVCYILGML